MVDHMLLVVRCIWGAVVMLLMALCFILLLIVSMCLRLTGAMSGLMRDNPKVILLGIDPIGAARLIKLIGEYVNLGASNIRGYMRGMMIRTYPSWAVLWNVL